MVLRKNALRSKDRDLSAKGRLFYVLVVLLGVAMIMYQGLSTVKPASGTQAVVYNNSDSSATAFPDGRRVLALSDGTLVTVFAGSTVSGGNNLIYCAYSSDAGVTWQSTSTGFYGKCPVMVKDNLNNLYLVYENQTSADPNSGVILFRKGAYSAGPNFIWSNSVQVDDFSGFNHLPSLAVDSLGNLHLVFDRHQEDAGNPRVRWFYNRGTNWGTTWQTAQELTLNIYKSKTTSGTFPSIVVDSNNNLFVTWFDGNGSFYIRRAVYSAGNWSWDANPWAAFANIGSPDSPLATPPTTTPNAMMMHSAVIKPGGGEIALVLPNSNSTTGNQYKLLISPTAGNTPTWTSLSGINGSAPRDGWPSLSADDKGNYYVFIKDSPPGYANISYYKYLRYFNALQPKLTLASAPAGNNSSYPSVMASVFNFRSHVLWTSGSASPYSVNYDYLNQAMLSIDSTYNLDGTAGSNSVNFGNVTPIGAAYQVSSDPNKHAVKLSVIADVKWDLTVQSSGNLTGSLGNTMPIDRLMWRDHGTTNTWTPFQSTPYSILLNQNPTLGLTLRHDYLLNVNWVDPPDSYSTVLSYIVSPKL